MASQLRERLSLDNWRTINRLTQGLTQRRAAGLLRSAGELDVAIAASATLSGFTLDNMTRDPGWRFLSIGRRLERLLWLCATLKQTLAGPAKWTSRGCCALPIRSSLTARYMARPEWLPVLDLLILDEANPRSVAFQLMG